MADKDDDASAGGDALIREAKARWKQASEWESIWRDRFIEDLKFRNADSDNMWQWPENLRQSRGLRPSLTMNMVRQHNLIISNNMRKSKSSVKFRGMGGGSSAESASVMRDIMRHIEFQSGAQANVYTPARGFQIDGGIGYWRLVTDYVSHDSFDQEIYIRPVRDPLSIYLDPDIQMLDGSDANWAFVFDVVPEEEWEEAYPEFSADELRGGTPLGMPLGGPLLYKENHMMVVEYFRRTNKPDTLLSFMFEDQRHTILQSQLPEQVLDVVLNDRQTRSRETVSPAVEWKLLVNDKLVDETTWPGEYIPIIRCVGEEYVLDGTMDRKGHTRSMKDAQRMYNYNASAQVEFVALQSKTPWIAPAKAIEQFERLWNTANTENKSVLPYNHVDEDGNPIPAPARQQPPSASPAYQAGMESAFNQMMITSGQYQNQLGMMGNERTGAAISERQAQSDTATFHFEDNYEAALLFTGRQIIDLIPKIYNTARTLQIVGEDGSEFELEINPAAAQALVVKQDQENRVVSRTLNPTIGRYDVSPTVGPAYGSKREETREALTLILTQNPQLTGIVGDLLLSSMDFDKAQEAARRMRNLVPKEALGEGPTPREQALMGQVQSLQESVAKLLHVRGKDKLKLVGKQEMRNIDAYEAETRRLSALAKASPPDEESLRTLVAQLVQEALGTSLQPIVQRNEKDLMQETPGVIDTSLGRFSMEPTDDASPIAGAQRGPDGEWYLADPTRKGKYMHIAPLAKLRGTDAQ